MLSKEIRTVKFDTELKLLDSAQPSKADPALLIPFASSISDWAANAVLYCRR